MNEQQLLSLKPELDRFLDRFAPLFGHDQNNITLDGCEGMGHPGTTQVVPMASGTQPASRRKPSQKANRRAKTAVTK